ncbi:MAG: hypothetical protein V7641_588 [Blastocatellia bacterium]
MHSVTNESNKTTFYSAIAGGHIPKAFNIATRAVAWHEAKGSADSVGSWLRRLSYTLLLRAKYVEGCAAAERAAEIHADPLKRSHALYQLAAHQVRLSHFTRTLITLGQAEEAARLFPEDLCQKARLKEIRAWAFWEMGAIAEALSEWEQAASLRVKAGDLWRATVPYNNLGYVLLRQHRLKEAEGWLLRALGLLEKQPHPHTEAGILDSIGHAYTLMGRYNKAQQCLDQSADIFEAIPDKAQLIGTLLHRSTLHERKREWQAAQDEARRALQIATEIQLEHLRRDAQQQLASIEVPRYKAIDSRSPFHGIVFASDAMRTAIARLMVIAATNENVLILGETGTGKELAACAIHNESRRSNRPFVPFNCSTLSRELIESRLFGHRRGAFTSADRDDAGVIRAAAGGTVFLDEIGDLPLEVQGALLRFLQSGEVQPVGASVPTHTDVRVIAATNRDLPAEVAAGRFRKDLYYRLNAVTLNLPPLWQRPADVRELAHHFVQLFCAKFSLPAPLLSEAELARLLDYDWPGNVRELENYIRQRVLFGDVPALRPAGASAELAWRELSEAEKHHRIRKALEESAGNMSTAAQQLGISRRTIQKLRRKWQDASANRV